MPYFSCESSLNFISCDGVSIVSCWSVFDQLTSHACLPMSSDERGLRADCGRVRRLRSSGHTRSHFSRSRNGRPPVAELPKCWLRPGYMPLKPLLMPPTLCLCAASSSSLEPHDMGRPCHFVFFAMKAMAVVCCERGASDTGRTR